MKIYKISEAELDRRLILDKKISKDAFCYNYYESDETVPAGFCELQDKIRDSLEAQVVAQFGDSEAVVESDNFGLSILHENFLFPADPVNSERIILELNCKILTEKLIGLILSYLEKLSSHYCIIAAVFSGKGMKGTNYIGRFVINHEEIAVEDSLVEIWSKQVQFLAVEN
ncbi:MAG TPA: hypothetical protein VMF08_17605 [Candidatus Sulfotelmatobacter sp.]|nr:hypothetical protein [Candidatus Sulfotelmatobacter sp.]